MGGQRVWLGERIPQYERLPEALDARGTLSKGGEVLKRRGGGLLRVGPVFERLGQVRGARLANRGNASGRPGGPSHRGGGAMLGRAPTEGSRSREGDSAG